MEKDTLVAQARDICQRFANAHKVIFEDHGEVGFGRPCVGFLRQGYVDIHPHNRQTYEEIWPRDTRLDAPAGVEAYHKHDCLSVLVQGDDYDAGIIQLASWVRHLESQGEIELVEFQTGATGIQILLSGIIGYAFKFKEPK